MRNPDITRCVVVFPITIRCPVVRCPCDCCARLSRLRLVLLHNLGPPLGIARFISFAFHRLLLCSLARVRVLGECSASSCSGIELRGQPSDHSFAGVFHCGGASAGIGVILNLRVRRYLLHFWDCGVWDVKGSCFFGLLQGKSSLVTQLSPLSERGVCLEPGFGGVESLGRVGAWRSIGF